MSEVFELQPISFALGTALRRLWTSRRFRFEHVAPDASNLLLIDVSVIIQNDAHTGIQRVVRALLGKLNSMSLKGFKVLPIFATRDHGYCRAEMTADGKLRPEGNEVRARRRVKPDVGDVFLGLDLAANILPYTEREIAGWRRKGVAINFLVYDLLPLNQPQWFGINTVRNFSRWIGVIARQADRCICISKTVAHTLVNELLARGVRNLPEIADIPLGSDLASTFPTCGLPADISALRTWIARHRVLLSVGTIEPRKGHRCVLQAMTEHWQSHPDDDLALLVIGKPGWKTEELQAEFRLHPEYGKRLLWLDQASDQLLAEMYSSATGLIAASRGEGFGLPLLEALSHGTPVLARDLPVFREIGREHLQYFTNDSPATLAAAIKIWLRSGAGRGMMPNVCLPTWDDSARALLDALGIVPEPIDAGP